jgi:hypothetical protein
MKNSGKFWEPILRFFNGTPSIPPAPPTISPAPPSPRRWPRPADNGFHDLPEEVVAFMQETISCPYCHAALFEGPSGGMSLNVFCGNPDCNSRFNIGPPPLPFGQFTGTCPEDFIAERRRKTNEREA